MSYESYQRWADERLEQSPELSVVIPAYNESQRIVPTIAAIAGYLCSRELHWELIVADDGSTDGTAEVVERLDFANCRVLRSPVNRGKGDAVRRGLRAAAGTHVLFTDADLSTPIEEIEPLLDAVREGADVAVGSRGAEGANEHEKGGIRSIVSGVFRLIARLTFPIGVRDSQCGFKLFRREVAQELADLQTIDGFSFDLELLWIARRLGYRIAELPVQWIDAPGSKVDPAREALRFLRDMVLIRWRHQKTSAPRQLHVGVVSPHPPSKETLNEYGFHLVRHLAAKPGVGTVTLFCDESDEGVPQPTLPNVDVVPSWRFDSVMNALRILVAVRRARPDVVFFNVQFASFGSRKIPAALGLFTPALLRLFGVRTVVLLHNLVDTVDLDAAGFGSNRLVNRALMAIGRLLTRVVLCADRVAVTIPAYVEVLRERYGATNVYLAPHGTFGEPRDVDLSLPATPRLMTFGKFGTYKRVETLIEAYRELLRRGHDVELMIAGSDSPNSPGYLAEVEAANPDLERLVFTGYVAEEQVPEIFESSTMVVFPYTATTGSSGPLHQAGEFGRAAVLPRIGDLLEIIEEEGFTGEPFEAGSAESLADAIERLLVDRDRLLQNAATNAAAARGLPMEDVVDWHLLHLSALGAAA